MKMAINVYRPIRAAVIHFVLPVLLFRINFQGIFLAVLC